jgi:hypothetical protein
MQDDQKADLNPLRSSSLVDTSRDESLNPNVTFEEESVTKVTKKIKIVEEIITYEQYLKEQEDDKRRRLGGNTNSASALNP